MDWKWILEYYTYGSNELKITETYSNIIKGSCKNRFFESSFTVIDHVDLLITEVQLWNHGTLVYLFGYETTDVKILFNGLKRGNDFNIDLKWTDQRNDFTKQLKDGIYTALKSIHDILSNNKELRLQFLFNPMVVSPLLDGLGFKI